MKILVDIVTEVTAKSLSKIKGLHFADAISDPVKFNNCRNRIVGSVLGIILYFKYVKNRTKIGLKNASLEKIFSELDTECGGTTLFSKKFHDLTKNELKLLEKHMLSLDSNIYNECRLCDFYESLYSVEYVVQNGLIVSKIGKSSRNNHGSYYTPSELAENCVRLTLDNYIFQKIGIEQFSFIPRNIIKDEERVKVADLLLGSDYADLSSGTGRFLLQLLEYFKSYILGMCDTQKSKGHLRKLLKRIYAIDVDSLALEVSKFELLGAIGDLKLYKNMQKNFYHTNPLLDGGALENFTRKEERYSEGFIYHPELCDVSHQSLRFDVIIGNPPWEKIRFEDKSFFSVYYPRLGKINKKDLREKAVIKLKKENPKLFSYYKEHVDCIDWSKKNIKESGSFTHSSYGELNTYSLFTELAINHLKENGVVGLILKSAIVSSPVNKAIYNWMISDGRINLVYDFINSNKIFNIDGRERFCFLLLGNKTDGDLKFAMNLKRVEELLDDRNTQSLSIDDLRRINPDTLMLPNTSTTKEISSLLNIFKKNSLFNDCYAEVNFGRIVHFTSHSKFIHKKQRGDLLPIYEGKFIQQYDGRFSGFDDVSLRERYSSKAYSKNIKDSKKRVKSYVPEVRYYIDKIKWEALSKRYKEEYSLMWRSLTSATNKRTCIATILPTMPTSQSIQLLQVSKVELPFLLGLFNSIVFDFIVKLKLTGIDLTQSIIRQMPVPKDTILRNIYVVGDIKTSLRNHITDRVLMLLKDDSRLTSLCEGLISDKRLLKTGYIDNAGRRKIQMDIDMLVACAYGLDQKVFKTVVEYFDNFYCTEEIDYLVERYAHINDR